MMSQNNNQEISASAASEEPDLYRHGGITYLHIPAVDVHQSATFYERVFGWNIHHRETAHPGFSDGSRQISGAWVTDQVISHEPGLLPYIYVDHLDKAIERIKAEGGEIVMAPYPEGTLWVATFRDPAGNVMGVWQEGSR